MTTEGSEVANSTNLVVLKSSVLPALTSGDVQTFLIEVVNEGPQPAINITLTDDLTSLINDGVGAVDRGFISSTLSPGSSTGLSCSTESISATGRRLICDFDTLPVCTAGVDCPVVTVEVRPGGWAGVRTNDATAFSADVADINPSDNTDTATYEIDQQRADLTITKAATPNPAVAGQNLVYVLTVISIDNGLSAAENVTITDLLPLNVTFISATPSVGSCSATLDPGETTVSGDKIDCAIGTLMNGSQRTVTVIVSPNSATRGTSLTNPATVATTTPETDLDNNQAQVTTPISNPRVDLLTNKTDSLDPVAIGENTVYTVTIRNNGPSVAENATLTDKLPVNRLSFQSVSVSGDGVCGTVPAVNAIGGDVVCSWPRLGVGESRNMTVTMRGVAKGPTQNVATASSIETLDGFDANPSNNTVSQITTVRTRADMEVTSKVPSVNPANLREPFTYLITVRNNTGAVLSEADDVVVTDLLPAGVELTGAPIVAIASGSASQTNCEGTAGATSFSCTLGTVATGSVIQITVPVEVTAVASYPETITNTATVSTSSLDVVPSNNSASNTLTINSSSLSGRLFRDFNDNTTPDAVDTGMGGITITLSGTAIDGTAISLNVTTGSDGTFTFGLIPQGTYTLTEGTISEAWLENGGITAGTTSGTVVPSGRSITDISLPANTAATGYLLAKVPTARVGLAKRADAPTVQADGSVLVNFAVRLRNFSLEPLRNITITDSLAGATPSAFGSHVPNPSTGTLEAGQYTIVTPPSNGCGTANAGFNGDADTTLLSGATRVISAGTCTITFQLRYQPVVPLPTTASGDRWQNQARVTADGEWSRQTSATNLQLDDLSHNGTNADPNGNGSGIDNNTPTPLSPTFSRSISLVKTADVSGIGNPVAPGDPITFSFEIRNTGNVTLTDVVVTDPLLGGPVTAGPIPILLPRASVVQTQVYALTAADVAARQVTNQATASGTWQLTAAGLPERVSDLSGTAQDNNTPTEVSLGDIAVVKTADESGISTPPAPGDVVTYRFAVSNLGSATLTNIILTDPLPGLTLSVNTIASLPAGAVNTSIVGTYVLTQTDIDRGFVENSATVTGTFGTDGSGNPVMVSDETGATVTDNIPTIVPDLQAPSVSVVKIADATGVTDPAKVGQTITYSFEIANTGNVTLTNVVLTDPLGGLQLTGTPIASLAPGDTDTLSYSGTYVIGQADIDAGQVTNQANVTGDYTDQNGDPQTVSDLSGATFTDEDPTVVLLSQAPVIDLVKTVDSSGLSVPAAPGEMLTYAFRVENTGNVTLTNVTLSDPLLGPLLIGKPIPSLAPGAIDSVSFSGTYAITQAEIDAGLVTNQAAATGEYTDPVTGLQTTEAFSGSAPGTADPTVAPIARATGLELVKTADTIGLSVPPVPGDVIAYTFQVTNTGNTTLTAITVSDPLAGPNLAPVSVPILLPGSTATAATGTYALLQADIDAGTVTNTATATGTDAIDGPLTATDTVITPVDQLPGIDLVKTVSLAGLSTPPVPGDLLSYAFTVTNTGTVTLYDVTVTDLLPGIEVSGAPITLAPGASDTTAFTATYAITQDDIDVGLVINQATATGGYTDPVTGPDTVSDLSGTVVGQDGSTVVTLEQNPGIAVVKTAATSALSDPPVAGDVVTYSFEITNTGNVTFTNVTLTDPLPDLNLNGSPIPLLIPGARNSTAYSATYALTQDDVDAGGVTNQATATGKYVDQVTGLESVSYLSGASLTTDDQTEVSLAQEPALTLIKRATVETPSGIASAPGDVILYRFEVRNTGNVTVTDITLDDRLLGSALLGGSIASLAPGGVDTTTFSGSYILQASDFVAAEVVNQATARGTANVGGVPTPITVVSGTNVDNTDPTVVPAGTPEISLTIGIADITDTNGNGIIDAGDEIIYSFRVTNTGNVALTDVNMDAASLSLPLGLVCTTISLAPGETQTLACTGNTYTITLADLPANSVSLSGIVNGTSVAGVVVSDDAVVGTPAFLTGGFALSKTAERSQVNIGDAVTYTITLTNLSTTLTTTTNLVDVLPTGFIYQIGTATLDGVSIEPLRSGRSLSWSNVTLAPGASAVAILDALVGGSVRPGTHDNVVRAISPATGREVTREAIATVRVTAEAVFFCSTVIGRVFDDPNQDGYFHGEPPGDRAPIGDQTHEKSKYPVAPDAAVEKGLPGVRLITPDGLAITTDQYGRFSVPCAALPADIGSNFMLKLDTRTLPSGYRLTTENPSVVRLTPGMITKLNFGAAAARLIRVDLSDRAFQAGDTTVAPRPEVVTALQGMVEQIANTPAMLRISYKLAAGESDRLARRRMWEVEKMLRSLWHANGRYQLNVETVLLPNPAIEGKE